MRATPRPLLRIRQTLAVTLLPFLLLASSSAMAQNPLIDPAATPATVPPTQLLQVSPKVIAPVGGKLPSSMTVAILESNCNPDAPKTDLNGAYLVVTAAGLSVPAKGQQKNTGHCEADTTLRTAALFFQRSKLA